MVLQQICADGHFPGARTFSSGAARVRACAIDVMSLPSAQPAVPIPGKPDRWRRVPSAPGLSIPTSWSEYP